MMVRIRAIQFLRHATFGPTEPEIATLSARMKEIGITRAAEEWIDDQFTKPVSEHYPLIEDMLQNDGFSNHERDIWTTRYRNHAFWEIAVRGEDQLRQRLAWALAQIVVIGETGENFNNADPDVTGNGMWLGLVDYHDQLVDNAFGSYRDILDDVTHHPCMGVYLSHNRNRKENQAQGIYPDENYAREIMQLFSIGLYELDIDGTIQTDAQGVNIPTYDNETIKSFARLFTGLVFNRNPNFYWGPVNFSERMVMFQNEHDTQPKDLLNGYTTPAGMEGEAEIQLGLDNVFNHPNVGPFVARRLIQRLVKSNPSKGYIRRVAQKFNDNGSGQRGDLKAVVKQILLDREAWSGVKMRRRRIPLRLIVSSQGPEHSRMQEPVLQWTAYLRRYGSTDYANGWMMMPNMAWQWVQSPYKSPSVFNFFSPDFQPNGDVSNYNASENIPNGELYAPEFQLFDSVVANRQANMYRWATYWGPAQPNGNEGIEMTIMNTSKGNIKVKLFVDISNELALADDSVALVDYLDVIHCNGTMPRTARTALINAMEDEGPTNGNEWRRIDRVRGAMMSILSSSYHTVTE